MSKSLFAQIRYVYRQPDHRCEYGSFITRFRLVDNSPTQAERLGLLRRLDLRQLPWLELTPDGFSLLVSRSNHRAQWIQTLLSLLVSIVTFIAGMVVDRRTDFISKLLSALGLR